MQAQYLPHKGELSVLVNKNHLTQGMSRAFKVSDPSCGCDQEGRRLSWETGIEEVGFEVFLDRCDRGAISYLEGERVPKNWGVVTERSRKVFDL